MKPADHFLLVQSEIILKKFAVFYDRAVFWSNPDDTIDLDFIDKWTGGNAWEAIGISLGDSERRLDIIKPIGKGEGRSISINLILIDLF